MEAVISHFAAPAEASCARFQVRSPSPKRKRSVMWKVTSGRNPVVRRKAASRNSSRNPGTSPE